MKTDMTSEAATNYDSNNNDSGPPQLAVGLPSTGDVTRTLKHPDLPVDILLVTVKDCEFLACYNELKAVSYTHLTLPTKRIV